MFTACLRSSVQICPVEAATARLHAKSTVPPPQSGDKSPRIPAGCRELSSGPLPAWPTLHRSTYFCPYRLKKSRDFTYGLRQQSLDQVGRAIQPHFAAQAATTRLRLKDLFGRGRISLLMGLSFLSLSIGLGEVSNNWLSEASTAQILHQSVLIGGWVAMWRPMEIFLYDWWPIAAHIRLLDRLATMTVQIVARSPAVTTRGHRQTSLPR